MQCVKK